MNGIAEGCHIRRAGQRQARAEGNAFDDTRWLFSLLAVIAGPEAIRQMGHGHVMPRGHEAVYWFKIISHGPFGRRLFQRPYATRMICVTGAQRLVE